jgi:L-alanine-DL-glutamate epimerase-like enolase superfamily enzyme
MTEPTIARVRAVAVAPDVERFRYTAFADEVSTTTVVRVTDSDGAEGVGAYDADSDGGWDLAPLETLRALLPRLIGRDAGDRIGVEAMLTDGRTSPFPPAVRSTRLRAARSAFGSLTLMHDAECRYDRDGAELVARTGGDVGLRWLEGPLPDLDPAGYRSLRQAVPGVPILPAGDAIWDPRLLARRRCEIHRGTRYGSTSRSSAARRPRFGCSRSLVRPISTWSSRATGIRWSRR